MDGVTLYDECIDGVFVVADDPCVGAFDKFEVGDGFPFLYHSVVRKETMPKVGADCRACRTRVPVSLQVRDFSLVVPIPCEGISKVV